MVEHTSINPNKAAHIGHLRNAILGDTLFMGTLDAQLIAIDAKTGKAIWKTAVAKTTDGYSITHAPLVVKDKVIVGVGGGEYGIRGFIAAYNVTSGKEERAPSIASGSYARTWASSCCSR